MTAWTYIDVADLKVGMLVTFDTIEEVDPRKRKTTGRLQVFVYGARYGEAVQGPGVPIRPAYGISPDDPRVKHVRQLPFNCY